MTKRQQWDALQEKLKLVELKEGSGGSDAWFHFEHLWDGESGELSGQQGKKLRKKTEEEMFDWSGLTTCGICGRTLTNPKSVMKGIGPVCEKHMGPGRHPSGSPQSVHAGKRGVVVGAKREGLAEDKYGKPKPFTKRPDAIAWLEAYGVEIEPKSLESVTLDALNDVAKEVNKLPDKVLDDVERAKCGMDLVADSGVTAHPELAHLRDVKPSGWELTDYTWASVPGMGATRDRRDTVIVANKLGWGHGSQNLVLHEHAHTFDLAQDILYGKFLSESDEWLKLHKSVEWFSVYMSSHPAESFAESFADYFDSEDSRYGMPLNVAVYFEELFPDA